jgi:hypothetical protein
MNFLNNLSKNSVKALFALIIILSIIAGFFTGLVPVEFFTGISGLIISHYFESQKTEIVQKQLDNATVELQKVKSENVELLSIGKK